MSTTAEKPMRAGSGALRFDPLLSGRPDIPVPPIAARAAVARALDRFVHGERYERLRATYEAQALPSRVVRHDIVFRASLAPEQMEPLLDLLERTRADFFELLGPAFAAPLPGPDDRPLEVFTFRDRPTYEAYMHAFLGYGADVDGVYVEESAAAAAGRLFTYARIPGGARPLEETLAHEYAHYLAGRHIFPGSWHDAGYHAEPKGWADEGLAELLAARATGAGIPLQGLCEQPNLPALATLLSRRDGYDRYGSFAYDEAHALARYLLIDKPEAGRPIFGAYRRGTYRLNDVAALAQVDSLADLEQGWYAALRDWCARSAVDR
jgi:hypothetical protein